MIMSGIYPVPLYNGILLYWHFLPRHIALVSLVLRSGRALDMRSTQPVTVLSTKMSPAV